MPLVCITGDVHHNAGIFEGNFLKPKIPLAICNLRNSEYLYAREYANVAKDHLAKVTLFVTGKCLEKHNSFWKSLSKEKHVELGAHTYAMMPFYYRHLFFLKYFNSYYGPYFYQKIDIKKTLRAFETIGMRPRSWRTHGYWGNETTYKILGEYGFNVVSDMRMIGDLQVKMVKGSKNLKHISINVMTDDQIAEFYVKKNYAKVKQISKRLKESIFDGIKKKRDLVVQLHPKQQKLLDNYKTFETILERLSENGYSSLTMTELADKMHVH
jgi:peptidoglycan/xylan/chitin deacetylase (PgdA/CDA1 family)